MLDGDCHERSSDFIRNQAQEPAAISSISASYIFDIDDQIYRLDIPHNDGIMNGKLCGFWDREFPSMDQFSNHMKLFGYICNNCLNYFSNTPWFALVEADFNYI